MPHCKYGSVRKEKQAEQQQRCNKDMIRELQDQKGQLLEENNQLRGENDQLVEVQGQDLKTGVSGKGFLAPGNGKGN